MTERDGGLGYGHPGSLFVGRRARGRILVIEPDPTTLRALLSRLRGEGFEATSAANPIKGLSRLSEFDPQVVLMDLRMPGMDGIAFMERVRELSPDTMFVVMTSYASIGEAVAAVKHGAEHYLPKPLDESALLAVVERALDKARLLSETRGLRGRLRRSEGLGSILGDHPSIQRVRQVIEQVAPTAVTVLVSGETGTGKELVAKALHEQSPRVEGPFVKLNCAALAESILESELFGHERGAFTGATGRREGRFMQADGGTLFLDEVGEIPATTQVKLLRFLQEREFERVGGNETIHVDVRLIAATNRNLRELVAEGRFREDLFYRLNIVHVDVPPLRERRADIRLLAVSLLSRLAEQHGRPIDGFTPDALEMLIAHDWPGNVRELENAIERAVVMTNERWIRPEHLSPVLGARSSDLADALIPGSSLAEIERVAILRTLEAVGGSTSRAAAMLGISPRKIQYRRATTGRRLRSTTQLSVACGR
jgi:DNA-binding NtrC family response regulator